MEKIEFKWKFPLSGKILFEMIINKWEKRLQEYIDSWEYTWIWITAMRMPAYEIVWDSSGQVFKILAKYLKENWEPYVDSIEIINFEELDILYLTKWVDEDIKKMIIPILENINLLFSNSSINKDIILDDFIIRKKWIYKKLNINNLDVGLQKFIKNGFNVVEERMCKILYLKK